MCNSYFMILKNGFKACSGFWGCLVLLKGDGRVSVIVAVSVITAFYCLFSTGKEKFVQAKVLATVFTLFIALGVDLIGIALEGGGTGVCTAAIAAAGVWFLFDELINRLYGRLQNLMVYEVGSRVRTPKEIKACYAISFFLIWVVYLIYFLNQYPGSLSCDTPAQLAQAVRGSGFENANPFINTLMITFWVQIGLVIDGNVNTGVGLYTFFQLTLASAIYAFVVTSVFRKGFRRLIVGIVLFWFAAVPFNIVYAVGMWKDSFFAMFFLLTVTYIWNLLEAKDVGKKELLILAGLACISSLCRNSGWSALMIFCVAVLCSSLRNEKKMRRIIQAIVAGVVLNFMIIVLGYPLIGVSTEGSITSALSVPIQQISRTVAVGCDLTDEEKALISLALDVEEIPLLYDETISDPIKFSVNKAAIAEYMEEYARLWIRLGIRYPKCYLDAYTALTRNYWYPDMSSWTWDARIFENDLGVVRTPLLFVGHDLTNLFDRMYDFPNGSKLKSSSVCLWLMLLSLGLSSARKQKNGVMLIILLLGIYIGLMFTSPVALFRYTYGAVLCLPLVFCWPYMKKMNVER